MQTTPKSLRLHLAILGRTNVGKSTFMNFVAGQDLAITSSVAGTTTDVVEKAMELLPIGPVVLLDTAGLDDVTALGVERKNKTYKALEKADVMLLVTAGNTFGVYEEEFLALSRSKKKPLIVVVNKADVDIPSADFRQKLKERNLSYIEVNSLDYSKRDQVLTTLKDLLAAMVSPDFHASPPLIQDILPKGGLAVLIVPIDIEAPKGRLILPQVQTIRAVLDHGAVTMVVKESEYAQSLRMLKANPALVVCDSQVVDKMVAETPEDVPCTTFSILFGRLKGNLEEYARGAAYMDALNPGDRILIAEACSHHALDDDIGRVKIPRWLKQYTGYDLQFDVTAGLDFPLDLSPYKLIVQCGGCMVNNAAIYSRLQRSKDQGVPITNYGICISKAQHVLERVLTPFTSALNAYNEAQQKILLHNGKV